MRVLAFGTYDTRLHPRVLGIIEGMRAHGDDVREVNFPLGMSTADKVAALKNPLHLPAFALRIISRWSRLVVASVKFHGKNRPDVILVGYMGHFDVVLARLCFPRTHIVLDHLIGASNTARDRGEKAGPKTRLLALLDRIALTCANTAVVDTEEHLAQLPKTAQHKGVVVHVGAPQQWFDASTECGDDPGYAPGRVMFYGLFTPLQGAETIAQAIVELRRRGNLARFTLVGDGQDAEAVRRILGDAPVDWHTWVDSDKLPELVAGHDICLGIFGDNEKGRNVVPNKVFQGAAAGCAIVTSETPPQQRVLGTNAVLVTPGDPKTLADGISWLLEDPARLADYRLRARDLAVNEFAPKSIVMPLRAKLGQGR